MYSLSIRIFLNFGKLVLTFEPPFISQFLNRFPTLLQIGIPKERKIDKTNTELGKKFTFDPIDISTERVYLLNFSEDR